MGQRSELPRADATQALSPRLVALAAAGDGERRQRGYLHTLAEICQQPETWRATTRALAPRTPRLAAFLRTAGITPGRGLIVLTGSGSSQYVGDSLALPLQQALGVPVQTIASGSILTHPDQSLPHQGGPPTGGGVRTPGDLPCVAVSFARSGDSPESVAAVDLLLARRPACHHVIITCNGRGRLATRYLDDPRVLPVVLDDRTCDRSLVMTSSFTNMVLAGRALSALDTPDAYVAAGDITADAAAHLLARDADRLASLAARPFTSVVFLASAPRVGAAREAALKLLEMTEGRVRTLAETFLGLRHGPMSTVHADTLIVAFLSSDPIARAYERDLLHELDRKRLGAGRLLVGARLAAPGAADPRDTDTDTAADTGTSAGIAGPAEIPTGTGRGETGPAGDTIVEYAGAASLADDQLVVLDVLVAQLLAFFRCMEMGVKPDDPSSDGVINRVVGDFAIHRR